MTEWTNSSTPPDVGRYLVFRHGEIRIAKWDGYGWIESLDFIVGEHTTHWAKLPKPPMSDNAQLFYDKSIEYGIGVLTKKWISIEEAKQMWPEVPNDQMD